MGRSSSSPPVWLPLPLLLLSTLLPQLPTSLPQPTMPRPTPMRSPPTPTPMPLPMTTQRPTSTPRRLPTVPAMSRDPTLLLFPMAESSVKYSSNGYDGYVADVTYEGTAVYPEAKPYAPAPYAKPAYAPAPAYHA